MGIRIGVAIVALAGLAAIPAGRTQTELTADLILTNGKILTVDRQTTVAVDTTEQTAAKTALQNAAAELTSRIAPKLIGSATVAAVGGNRP